MSTRPRCAPSFSVVDSRAIVEYPREMSLPLHRPAPKARRREEVGAVEWSDWRWQLRHRLTQLADLEQFVALTDEERRGVALAPELFRVGITPYYASLMDRERADCPVRM
jgi:lysine 2,3-aminomutase